MIFLFAALGNVYAQAPTLPTLPQKTVSLTLPTQGTSTCPTLTTGSNCIRNVPSGNATSFQNAINAATCGDTIVLAAGSTYSGNFTIPSTSCSGWIEIVSSALASLPVTGQSELALPTYPTWRRFQRQILAPPFSFCLTRTTGA